MDKDSIKEDENLEVVEEVVAEEDENLEEACSKSMKKEESEKVDMKDSDEDDDMDDDDELDTDDIKKESYQDRDQPKVETKAKIDDTAPAGKVAKDTDKPFIDGMDPTAKVPAGKVAKSKDTPYMKCDAKMAMESVEQMFEGAEQLSEDFMTKASTIFEAAFNSKLKESAAKIEAELQEQFDADFTALEEELAEKVDEYLDYVVTEWVEQNEVAIQESVRSEIAENFLEDFKALFEKHNITIPQDKVDLLEQAEDEIEEMKARINELTESNMEQKKVIFENEKAKTVAKLSEGLAETQVEKLKSLVEDVDAKDIETFNMKAKVICESFLGKGDKTVEQLNEGEEIIVENDVIEEETDEKKVRVHPSVSRYVESARLQHGK